MRLTPIAGLLLLIIGFVFLLRGGTFGTRRDVLDVGGLRVSATEQHSITPWMAGGAMLAGAVLLFVGFRGNTTTRARF